MYSNCYVVTLKLILVMLLLVIFLPSVCKLKPVEYGLTSRDIIRNAVNASEHDSVIFVGNGATGGVHKLIHALDLKKPPVTMYLLIICLYVISARVVYYKNL